MRWAGHVERMWNEHRKQKRLASEEEEEEDQNRDGMTAYYGTLEGLVNMDGHCGRQGEVERPDKKTRSYRVQQTQIVLKINLKVTP